MSQQYIKIGLLATLLGPFKVMGEEGVRGATLALAEFGHEVGGVPVELVVEGTNAVPQTAVDSAYLLFARQNIDFLVGPLSGNEGLAIRDYAKTVPDRVFINGTAASQDITLRNPADNFFSFSMHGVQWMAGLGTYAYGKLGYRRVVTIGEDYSYPHAQVAGFMLEFCRAGGEIINKVWLPLGTTDFRPFLLALEGEIDAIFVALAGRDAVNFLEQYAELGGNIPLIAGPSAVDTTVLGRKEDFPEHIIGVASAGSTAAGNPAPEWQKFVQAYRTEFPDGMAWPSATGYGYYVNMKAALLALQAVDCDLSNGQAKFKQALRSLEFETPTGLVKVDHNRQAIANNYVSVVDADEEGRLYTRLVEEIPCVNQTLGIPEDQYLALGPITAHNPTCEQIRALDNAV